MSATTSSTGHSGSNAGSQSGQSTARDQPPLASLPPAPEVFERPKLSSKSNDEEILKEVVSNSEWRLIVLLI